MASSERPVTTSDSKLHFSLNNAVEVYLLNNDQVKRNKG